MATEVAANAAENAFVLIDLCLGGDQDEEWAGREPPMSR